MYGQYIKITNRWEGVLTGKSPTFGGSCGRSEATGYGVVFFLKNMLDAHDSGLKNKKVVISGAGNVALYAAEKCLQEGANVLSVSDSDGTLYSKDGLSEDDLQKIKKLKFEKRGRLTEFGGGEFKDGKKPWKIENADIAIPCATQNEVNKDDASPHFSPPYYCDGHLPRPVCILLGQGPRHSVNYACGPFGRKTHTGRIL